MPYFHTRIPTSAPINALTIDNPLTELDNALLELVHQHGANPLLPPYNLTGLSTEDATAALQGVLDENDVIFLPPHAVFRCTEALLFGSNKRIYGGGTFLIDADMAGNGHGNAFLYAEGEMDHTTGIALPGNVDAGAFSFDLPTGQGANWAKGDWIVIESTDAYKTNPNTIYPKEVRQVYEVVDDTVYLDAPLVWSYTTAGGAKYYRMTPVENILIENIRITNTDPLTNRGYGIRLQHAVDVRVDKVDIYHSGGGLLLYGAHRFAVTDYQVHDLPLGRDLDNSSYGYGLTFDDTTSFGTVKGMVGGACRHVFSTVFEQRTGGLRLGGPQFCTIADSVGYGEVSGLSIWDTHDGGFDVTFDNVVGIGAMSDGTFVATGAQAGHCFQMRMEHFNILNCRAYSCGDRGISIGTGSRYGNVQGGEVAYNALNGISIGEACIIDGVHIHHNGQSGIACGAGVNDWTVVNNNIHDNSQDTAGYGGLEVQASGGTATTGWKIERNIIKYSSAQSKGVHFTNSNVTGKVLFNDFDGHSNSTTFTNLPASGVVVKNNEGYATRKVGATSVADGGTITHGLAGTPTRVNVTASVSGEFVSVTAKGASTFTVAIKKHDNSAGTTQTVYWEAELVLE